MIRAVVVVNASLSGPVRSDPDLWHAVGAGDEAAFRELFLLYSAMIYNYCFRRTASWSLAEDAVQATFATLWRRAVAGKVDELGLESARPILLAMARGECSNANRSRGRQVRLVDRMGGATSGAADNTAEWVRRRRRCRPSARQCLSCPRISATSSSWWHGLDSA